MLQFLASPPWIDKTVGGAAISAHVLRGNPGFSHCAHAVESRLNLSVGDMFFTLKVSGFQDLTHCVLESIQAIAV